MALTLPLAALATSCVACPLEACSVQANELPHKRELRVPAVGVEHTGLDLTLQIGTLEVKATDGTPELVLSLREAEPGDAHASLVDGRLVLTSTSGKRARIERLVAHVRAELPSVKLRADLGGVTLRGLRVAGAIDVANEVGDLLLEDCNASAEARLHADLGDVRLRRFEGQGVELHVDVGDVVLNEVRAKHVRIEAGLGDVDVRNAELESLEASSNVGDVRCKASAIGKRTLRVGLGSVVDEI